MDKATLRKLYKEKRNLLSPAEKDAIAHKIKEQLLNEFSLPDKTVSLFLPIDKFNEVNTYLIFEELKKLSNTTIALSRSNFQDNSMEHIAWTPQTQIMNNQWSIPEPQDGNIIASQKIDVVVIPLLICDVNGYRLGYGKGFYDRFLSQCKKDVQRIGINYYPPIDAIDHDEFDVPLHHLITGDRIYTFGH